MSERYRTLNESVTEMSNQLSVITERLEQINSKTEEASNNMTDASPLAKIKQCIAEIKTEINNMDIRIGVLCNTIMQHRLREKEKGRKEDVHLVLDEDDFED